MGKYRPLEQQLIHAVSSSARMGTSKRAERIQGRTHGIYSNNRAEALKDTAKDLARYVKEHYPDVKRAVDIEPEHVQSWLNYHAEKGNSERTLDEYHSRVEKIEECCRDRFGSCDFTAHVMTPEARDKGQVREHAMTREDFELVRGSFEERDARTDARTALEITARTGLRVHEVALLRERNIDLERGIISVENGKAGKQRDVPIRESDREYFRALKERTEDRVCPNVAEDKKRGGEALDRGIRREMERVGIADRYPLESDHAVRKMYARERMEELTGTAERKDPLKDETERKAWGVVQKELGHEADLRMALYRTYIGGK